MSNRPLIFRHTRRKFLAQLGGLGTLLATGNWQALAQSQNSKPGNWDETLELAVNLTIGTPAMGRAKKPYVAVWVEDVDGHAVRTLGLWVQLTGRGPTWISDLRRWARGETARRTADGGNLVATASSPTRLPGSYTVYWDGRNDRKVLVDRSEYYICVESVREHGPYQLVRQKISLGRTSFRQMLGSDGEIEEVSVEYRKR